jgi:hypothetical protein
MHAEGPTPPRATNVDAQERPETESLGGWGNVAGDTASLFRGLFQDPRKVRSDCRLVRTAIRRGWPIPQEVRVALAQAAHEAMQEPGRPARNALAAAELLVEMERDDVRGELRGIGVGLGTLRAHRRTRGA